MNTKTWWNGHLTKLFKFLSFLTFMADYEEDLLEDWWAKFWPKYCSSNTNQGNLESSQQVL